ncbi:MAG: hypothetical protein KAY31_04030, partial [Flavobacterium sp.]|nr:hypothetical protein [Flavobacterium sp.]
MAAEVLEVLLKYLDAAGNRRCNEVKMLFKILKSLLPKKYLCQNFYSMISVTPKELTPVKLQA